MEGETDDGKREVTRGKPGELLKKK